MILGIVALFVAGFIGGQSTLFLKFALKEMSPFVITFLRFVIASVVILPFFLNQKNLPSMKNFRSIAFYSIFFAGNVIIFSIAIQYTSAITSQILYTLVPIAVGFLSYYILGEKMTRQKIIGFAVAFIGVFLILQNSIRSADILSFGTPLGNILTLCAVISWSLYFVFSKRLTASFSPITTSFISYVVTVIILIPLIPLEQTVRPFNPSSVTIVGIASILILGTVSSALMFFLIQVAIQKLSAFLASFLQYLGPFSVMITAVPFLGEKLNFTLAAGGLLILFGVFYATTYPLLRRKTQHSMLK